MTTNKHQQLLTMLDDLSAAILAEPEREAELIAGYRAAKEKLCADP